MGQLVDQLGNKTAGQLVKSDDWNALVQAVEDIGTTLTARVDSLETQLNTRVGALETTLGQLQTDVTEMQTALGQFYRVTMRSSKTRYVLGELSEIVAKVTDLQGNDLDMASLPERPWIDFFATWGQLKPVAGFTSRGGAGDRSISVQTNERGEARVILRAEHALGLSEQADDEVAAALTTVLQVGNPTSHTVSDIILNANTPLEAKNMGAYGAITPEYEREDASSVRQYIDAFYVHSPNLVKGTFTGTQAHRWRDYRATVMAFVKSDDNPATPDHSRGVSSIHVTFRDWIGPWIILEYFDKDDIAAVATDFIDELVVQVPTLPTDSINDWFNYFQGKVTDFVRPDGLIGQFRDYRIVEDALGGFGVTDPPEFFNQVVGSVRNGVNNQQLFLNAENVALGLTGQGNPFRITAGLSIDVSSGGQVLAGFESEINTIAADVESQRVDTNAGFTGINERMGAFEIAQQGFENDLTLVNARVDNTIENLGAFETEARQANEALSTQIVTMQNDVSQAQIDIGAVDTRAGAMEARLDITEGKVAGQEKTVQEVLNTNTQFEGRMKVVEKNGITMRQDVNVVRDQIKGVIGLDENTFKETQNRVDLLWSEKIGG